MKMDTNFSLSTIAVIITIATMGFLLATPIMKRYYNQSIQAENQLKQTESQLSQKITQLKNKLKKKKKK